MIKYASPSPINVLLVNFCAVNQTGMLLQIPCELSRLWSGIWYCVGWQIEAADSYEMLVFALFPRP
jgi:hypothetical protein